MLCTRYFLKLAKINSSKKNQSVLIAKISSRETKNRQSAKINSRKNFVQHGMLITCLLDNESLNTSRSYMTISLRVNLDNLEETFWQPRCNSVGAFLVNPRYSKQVERGHQLSRLTSMGYCHYQFLSQQSLR